MDPRTRISLCITTHNRPAMTLRAFHRVLDDARINEIIISDDCSDDEEAETLMLNLEGLQKVRYYNNEQNLGVYVNKARAISLASNTRAILLDSDNQIDTDYLDTLYAIPEWDNKLSYLPDFAKPAFDYRHFNHLTLTRQNVAQYVDMPKFDCLINTMNGFYDVSRYLSVWDRTVEPVSADSIYMNCLLLEGGSGLKIVPGLQYEHLIHAGSHYKRNAHRSDLIHEKIMNRLKALR